MEVSDRYTAKIPWYIPGSQKKLALMAGRFYGLPWLSKGLVRGGKV